MWKQKREIQIYGDRLIGRSSRQRCDGRHGYVPVCVERDLQVWCDGIPKQNSAKKTKKKHSPVKSFALQCVKSRPIILIGQKVLVDFL